MAAPTFFGVSTVPDDTPGTLTEPQTALALTPPSSMQAGDLVVVMMYNENGSAGDGMQINGTGGQTWTSDTTNGSYSYSGSAAGHRIYWCRFNGTWSTNPTFDFPAKAGTRGCGMQMLVFRPDNSGDLWGLDTAPTWTGFSAPSTPFTVTVTAGYTPSNPDTVTIARWCSDDDNSWGTLSGSGWSKTGLGAQYRNQGGSDLSTTFAYNLQGTPTSLADVSQDQTALGGDAGSTVILTFYAYDLNSLRLPGAGAITATGQAPVKRATQNQAVPAGAIANEGAAPVASEGIFRFPSVGAIAVSGTTPAAGFGYGVGAGVVTITGQDVTWEAAPTALLFTPPVGAISVPGQAPSFSLGISAGVGAAAFSTYAPDTLNTVVRSPAAGAIALVSYQPTAFLEITYNIPAGSLVFSTEVTASGFVIPVPTA